MTLKEKFENIEVVIESRKLRLGSFKEEFLAVNMYKTAKEEYIKEVADKWKDKINIIVYNSLINL